MPIKIKDNDGFTLVEIIVVLVILTALSAASAPVLIGHTMRAKKTAAITQCNSCVSACETLAAQSYGKGGVTLASGSPPDYVDAVTETAGVEGLVTEIEISGDAYVSKLVYESTNGYTVTYENGEYTIEGDTSSNYFTGVVDGIIVDKHSVLLDLSVTISDYLSGMYKIEVTSTGFLNGYWASSDSSKNPDVRQLLKAVMAANGVEYNDSFASAKVWLDTADKKTVTCIEYKLGNNAYVYYSSGNTYVVENTAFATPSKINWENSEQAVLDAIAAGRADVYALEPQ